jgi:hypothetical protein
MVTLTNDLRQVSFCGGAPAARGNSVDVSVNKEKNALNTMTRTSIVVAQFSDEKKHRSIGMLDRGVKRDEAIAPAILPESFTPQSNTPILRCYGLDSSTRQSSR